MKNKSCRLGRLNVKAFTLIELLVVVLIIGILAAVALPQYQFAVGKARAAKLVAMANAVQQAQEAYFLANGEYTNKWDDLAIDFQGTQSTDGKKLSNSSGWQLRLYKYNSSDDPGSSGRANSVYATDDRLPDIRLIIAYNKGGLNEPFWDGRRACYAKDTSSLANKLCQHITHSKNKWGSGGGSNYYKFR